MCRFGIRTDLQEPNSKGCRSYHASPSLKRNNLLPYISYENVKDSGRTKEEGQQNMLKNPCFVWMLLMGRMPLGGTVCARFWHDGPMSFAICRATPCCHANVAQLWSSLSKTRGVVSLAVWCLSVPYQRALEYHRSLGPPTPFSPPPKASQFWSPQRLFCLQGARCKKLRQARFGLGRASIRVLELEGGKVVAKVNLIPQFALPKLYSTFCTDIPRQS